jgi:hypothetical protein
MLGRGKTMLPKYSQVWTVFSNDFLHKSLFKLGNYPHFFVKMFSSCERFQSIGKSACDYYYGSLITPELKVCCGKTAV